VFQQGSRLGRNGCRVRVGLSVVVWQGYSDTLYVVCVKVPEPYIRPASACSRRVTLTVTTSLCVGCCSSAVPARMPHPSSPCALHHMWGLKNLQTSNGGMQLLSGCWVQCVGRYTGRARTPKVFSCCGRTLYGWARARRFLPVIWIRSSALHWLCMREGARSSRYRGEQGRQAIKNVAGAASWALIRRIKGLPRAQWWP
jgi:hypothetical protein